MVLSRLGGAFSAAGMLPEAVSTLKAAIKLAPDRPELFSVRRGHRQGDLALAETQLRRAVSLDPSRTVDANALRYVVLMQEMVALQCEGAKDVKAIQSTLQARWTHEAGLPIWSSESQRMLNDADALLLSMSSRRNVAKHTK